MRITNRAVALLLDAGLSKPDAVAAFSAWVRRRYRCDSILARCWGDTTGPLILVWLLLAAFAINLDTRIVNVALPTLVRELNASTT